MSGRHKEELRGEDGTVWYVDVPDGFAAIGWAWERPDCGTTVTAISKLRPADPGVGWSARNYRNFRPLLVELGVQERNAS